MKITLKFLFYTLVSLVLFTKWSNVSKSVHVESIDCHIFREVIIVPIIINNKEYNFKYDTGAPTSISKELFSELNLSIIDTVNAIDYYGNKSTILTSIIPELSIGGIRLKDKKVSVLRPIQDLKHCGIKVDGHLGNDILLNKVVHIDIKNDLFQISNSIEPFTGNKSKKGINFTKGTGGQPYIEISFTGKNAKERVLFDTGSSNYLYRLNTSILYKMLENKHLSYRNIIDTISSSFNGRGLFGKQKDKFNYRVLIDSIEVMGKSIVNYYAKTFSSLSQHSIVGAPILGLGSVTIDNISSKLYFRPYDKAPADLSPKLGFTVQVNSENKTIVTNVLTGSFAEKNGIKKGQRYIKINDIDLDSLSLCDKLTYNWKIEYDKESIKCMFLDADNSEFYVTFNTKTNANNGYK